jgi:hypothetical protein
VCEALLPVLEGQRGLAQFGRWMRLLTETGRVERLLDLLGGGLLRGRLPREIRPVVAEAAEDPARDTALRFEAHNTLATWAYYDGDREACARHVRATGPPSASSSAKPTAPSVRSSNATTVPTAGPG